MKVVVVIPWRPTPERVPAYRHVRAWWAEHFPHVEVHPVDTGHDPYNLAAVRNLGVRVAEMSGADVVVISDADAIVATPDSLQAALAQADDGGLHLPFTAQRYLDAEETSTVLAGGMVSLDGPPGDGAMYVVQPSAYWRMGGSDERFVGWGGEDQAATAAAQTLIGIVRHPGTLWSLHHEDEDRPVGQERWMPNSRLAMRYGMMTGDRAGMLRLIAEEGRHGTTRENRQ